MNHETVVAVRDDLEQRGGIRHVATITDTKGRKQPARKPIRFTLVDDTPAGVSALKGRVKEVRAGVADG